MHVFARTSMLRIYSCVQLKETGARMDEYALLRCAFVLSPNRSRDNTIGSVLRVLPYSAWHECLAHHVMHTYIPLRPGLASR